MTRATFLTLSLLLAANWSHAAAPAVTNAVKVLLEKGWEKTVAAGKLPDHETLSKPPLSTDPYVLAARWLVLMHHNRYPDAISTLEIFSKTKPSEDLNLSGLRAAAWLQTIKQEYPKALIQADQLAQAASPNPPAKDNDLVQAQDEAIAFLGSLAGFLEGPCAKAADQGARAKFEERALQRLDEPRKKIFTDAKANTLAKFNKLSADLADAKSKSQQEAEAERQKTLADLSAELQKLSQEATKLENQKTQVKSNFDKGVANLDREDGPLQQNLLNLQGPIATANANASQSQTTLQNLQQQLNNAKDVATQQTLQNQIQQAQNTNRTAQNQLTQLNNQAAGIIRQRKTIETRKLALDRDATLETKKIEAQWRDTQSDMKKIEGKQNALTKAKPGPSRKVLALDAQVQALNTYYEFPLEVLRDALLKKVQ
jgi:hypothetical protein